MSRAEQRSSASKTGDRERHGGAVCKIMEGGMWWTRNYYYPF